MGNILNSEDSVMKNCWNFADEESYDDKEETFKIALKEEELEGKKSIEQLKQERVGYGTKADQSGYYLKGDEYKFEDAKEYIEGLSSETKKHIAATHLFGAIWKDFFMDDENKCEFMDYDANDDQSNIAQFILDHMLIRGGCVRDVIWGYDFNDVVNTRELNKLHLLHLKKFHSTHEQQEDSNCILWLHYAKKFDELKTSKETAEDFKDDNDGQMIIDSDYMLNAKFLLGILENDKRLKNKLSVARLGRTGRVFNIRIIDDILYSGFNLNGFDMDFLDIKHGIVIYDEQKRDEIEQIHTVRQNELITMRQTNLLKMPSADDYRAMYSIRVKSGLKLFRDVKHDDTAKAIDLPIYPLVFIDMSKWCDLTVNSAIIHYSDVLKNIDGEFTDENKIDYDWRPKAKNPSFEIDSIDDCKEYNVKVFGYELDDIKDVIRHCGTNIHIYRVAKMMMKLKGKDAKLDELLIEGTIAMYPEWISEEKLNENEEYCKKIAKGFVIEYLKKGLLDIRFQAFETLKFNEIVKDRMAKIPKFKNYIIQFIEEMKDEEMKQELKNVMKKYEYDI